MIRLDVDPHKERKNMFLNNVIGQMIVRALNCTLRHDGLNEISDAPLLDL